MTKKLPLMQAASKDEEKPPNFYFPGTKDIRN